MPQESRLPVHIGIIMDGNGRGAKKRGLPRKAGHKAGSTAFQKIVRYCNKIGIRYLTVYAFSTENWKRPPEEVEAILNLLREFLNDASNYRDENIRTRFVGDITPFDEDMKRKIAECEEASASHTGLSLNIAINYGGRSEITMAARRIAQEVRDGTLIPEDIGEETMSDYLYTKGQPDVDLIIRPSGEQRLSNFLLWQSAYAEYVFMDTLWPDFDSRCLDRALAEYAKRDRRFGGI